MRRLILNYHAIADPARGLGDVDPVYGLGRAAFREQLAMIRDLGLPVLPLCGPPAGQTEKGSLGLSLTFDDGHASDTEVVLPLLAEFGMCATFFVPAQLLVEEGAGRVRCRELIGAGHKVAAHGYRHRYLDGLPAAAQAFELQASKALLEDCLGQAVELFALPGGKYGRQTLRLARAAGYAHVLSTRFGFYEGAEAPFLLPRWTIKRGTSPRLLAQVLAQDMWTVRRQQGLAAVKRGVNGLLGNSLTDRLNYFLRT